MRLRRITKWMFAGIATLAATAWLLTLGMQIGVWIGNVGLSLGHGCLTLSSAESPGTPVDQPMVFLTMADAPYSSGLVWPAQAQRLSSLTRTDQIFPLWLVFSIAASLAGLFWHLDQRRVVRGACVCGYDLTGNTSGTCPECGHETDGAQT